MCHVTDHTALTAVSWDYCERMPGVRHDTMVKYIHQYIRQIGSNISQVKWPWEHKGDTWEEKWESRQGGDLTTQSFEIFFKSFLKKDLTGIPNI